MAVLPQSEAGSILKPIRGVPAQQNAPAETGALGVGGVVSANGVPRSGPALGQRRAVIGGALQVHTGDQFALEVAVPIDFNFIGAAQITEASGSTNGASYAVGADRGDCVSVAVKAKVEAFHGSSPECQAVQATAASSRAMVSPSRDSVVKRVARNAERARRWRSANRRVVGAERRSMSGRNVLGRPSAAAGAGAGRDKTSVGKLATRLEAEALHDIPVGVIQAGLELLPAGVGIRLQRVTEETAVAEDGQGLLCASAKHLSSPLLCPQHRGARLDCQSSFAKASEDRPA